MRRKHAIGVAILLVTAGLLLWHRAGAPDPVYEGRHLSSWLNDLDPPTFGSGNVQFHELMRADNPSHNKAVFAIQAIGTNAIPYLHYRLNHSQASLWDYLPDSITRAFPWSNEQAGDRWSREIDYKLPAVFACYVLGPRAAPLVPDLIQYEADGGPTWIWSAVANIGTNALPALTLCLTNSLDGHDSSALYHLHDLGPQAASVAPLVTTLAYSTNAALRGQAISTLMRIAPDQNTIPHVLRLLQDTNSEVHSDILDELWYSDLNKNWKPLGPALLKLALMTNNAVHTNAALALTKVDARLATNVLTTLKDVALSKTWWHAETGWIALEHMESFAASLTDELVKQFNASKDPNKCQLVLTIIKIDPSRGPEFLPYLTQKLISDNTETRLGALKAISYLGESARLSEPLIRNATWDRDERIRDAAGKALRAVTSGTSAISTRAELP